jgi:hypothetical protein
MTALQLALGDDVSGEGTVACDHAWLVFHSINGSYWSIKYAPSSRVTVSRLVTYTGWTSDMSLKCSFSMTLNVRDKVVWVTPRSVMSHRSTFNQRLVGFKAPLRSSNNVWKMSDIVAPESISAWQVKQSFRTVSRYGRLDSWLVGIFPTKWSGRSQRSDVPFLFKVKPDWLFRFWVRLALTKRLNFFFATFVSESIDKARGLVSWSSGPWIGSWMRAGEIRTLTSLLWVLIPADLVSGNSSSSPCDLSFTLFSKVSRFSSSRSGTSGEH